MYGDTSKLTRDQAIKRAREILQPHFDAVEILAISGDTRYYQGHGSSMARVGMAKDYAFLSDQFSLEKTFGGR